jgi:hypothetical protein
MDQDIAKIVELIDKKIKALTVTRQTLIAEFGNGKAETTPPLFKQMDKARFEETVRKVTRKQSVEKLLREQGPMARKDIIAKTGFSAGTVAFVLNDKTTFVSKNEKWHLIEENEEVTQ